MIKSIIRKSRFVLAGAVALGFVGATVFTSNAAVYAATCDKVNIVYCGVKGSDAASYISSFKSIYNSNKSGHASSSVKKDYTDIQAVYKWAGATPAMVNGMNTTNTKVGTLYRDGRIVVDGKTIATDAWVSARFTNGSGFTKVTDGVWARKTTTSFANASAKVIVYMKDGKMVFASMVECANAIKATPKDTPKPEQPKPEQPKPEQPKPETPKPETPKTPEVQGVSTTTPTELPQTGMGGVIGIFAGASAAGAAGHYFIASRRNKR